MTQALIGALRVTLGLDSAEFSDGASAAEVRLEKLGANLSRIGKVVAAFGAGIVGAMGVREIGAIADQWSDLSSQVGVAVRDMARAPEIMARIADIADASYSALDATAEAFARNNRSLSQMGYSTDQALRYTEALNNALVATATRGQRAGQVQDVLAKAMATGALEADGLDTILAHGGAIAEALAGKLGVTTNQLHAMRKAGKITGQVIVQSLLGNFDKLREQAESMPATMGDGFQILGNALIQIVGQFDQATGASGGFANGLVAVGKSIRENADSIISALRLIIATAIAAALVFSTRLAVSVGVTLVTAVRAAVAQTIALNMALGATSRTAAIAGAAVKGMTAALTLLRRALVTLGLPALVIGAGYLIDKFMQLKDATGSWGGALKALEQLGRQWAAGMGLLVSSVADRFQAAWLRIKGNWSEGALNEALLVDQSALQKQELAIKRFGAGWQELQATMATADSAGGSAGGGGPPLIQEAGEAAKKAAEALKKLTEEYRSLEDALLPGTADAREYRESLKLIDRAAAAGLKMAASVEELKKAAMGRWLDTIGKLAEPLADVERTIQVSTDMDFGRLGENIAAGLEKAEEPFRKMADFGKQLSDNLAQAIVHGQSLGEALVNSLKALAAQKISGGIFQGLFGDGSSSTTGLFGSLFAGFFADGGTIGRGQWGVVGERGPEAIYAGNGAMSVVPFEGGGGGGTTINVDARGATDPQAVGRAVQTAVGIAGIQTDGKFASRGRVRMARVIG